MKVSAGASVHTLVLPVRTLNQRRLQTQPCRKTDYANPANVHVQKQTYLVFFESEIVYVKLEEFEVIQVDIYQIERALLFCLLYMNFDNRIYRLRYFLSLFAAAHSFFPFKHFVNINQVFLDNSKIN